jgi:DnaJ-domain-containing protein 1
LAVAALIVALIFAGLFGVRLLGARRHKIRQGQVYAALLAGVGLMLAARGVFALAAGLGLAALFAWAWDKPQMAAAGQAPDSVDAEALRLLGLSPNPSAAQIRAAFRSKMAQAHPDKGGDSALAARLVAARDRLLGR